MGTISYSLDPIPIGDPVSNCDTAINLKIFTNKLAKAKKSSEKTLNISHILTSAATMTKKPIRPR